MLDLLLIAMVFASINITIVIVIVIVSIYTHKVFASKKARPQADPLDEDMEVRVVRRFITVKYEQIINGVDDVKKCFVKKCEKITPRGEDVWRSRLAA